MEGGVDEGDILEQRLFDIAPNDTALTLNTRCFEAGMESFPALVTQLEIGLRRAAQDFSLRSIHMAKDRPAAQGRIDFAQSAQQVTRLVRALDHGRYWNPLTTAKIATATRVLNVGSADLAEGTGAPGQVLSATPEGLIVACGTGAVRLNRLTCQIKGGAVCPSTITDTQLPALTDADALTKALAAILPAESRIRQALHRLNPAQVPGATAAANPDWQSLPLSGDLPTLALATARAMGQPSVDLAYASQGLPGYLSNWVPLTVSTEGSIATARAAITDAISKAQKHPSFPLDLMTRDTALMGLTAPQVALGAAPLPGSVITLTPTALHYDAARLPKPQAQALAARIAHVATELNRLPADTPLETVSALTESERNQVLHAHNATGAAVAAVTKNIAVRAGSCVVPLHHPARVAEEWAVIDNLTNGRAGIAVASGWHPDDFVLRPENAPPVNKAAMYETTDQLRRLWRGEGVDFPKADGTTFTVKTQPRPVSAELPIWVTTAGNPDTWREAGEIGANVLTHLLGQSIDEVAGKITIYHDALRKAGHDPANFTVTLMLHTFVGRDREQVRRTAEGPMKAYLGAATALVKQYAWTFLAFKKPPGVTKPMDIDTRDLTPEDSAAILEFAFTRYFEDSGLFGTVEDALARVEQLKRIGVSEVACLVDYGIAPEKVMEGLYPLAEVVKRANAGGGVEDGDYSIAAQIIRHGVTHLQCTPSMARMIAMNDEARMALSGIKTLMVGGEALPGALVTDLRKASKARILNMYGPTETTIWSSVEEVGAVEPISNIGSPLANQQMYVLDDSLAPEPAGTAGELWIGGDGVTRGYWQRADLTEDRFKPDPFVTPDRTTPWGARMYRSGDLVRWREDGKLDLLGRADFQVKLRGYRIELGEIEAVLEQQPGVKQAVVLAREDAPGDLRLVAYIVGTAHEAALRAELAGVLPDHMIPAHFVSLDALPLTPNRKVDRKALPAPSAAQPKTEAFVAPTSDIESQLAAIWGRILGVPKVGAPRRGVTEPLRSPLRALIGRPAPCGGPLKSCISKNLFPNPPYMQET